MFEGAAIHVLAIAVSLRSGSSNAVMLGAASRLAPAGMIVELYQGLGSLPHFNPDLDVDPAPEPVRDLRARVGASDCLLISCPEYAHGVPGRIQERARLAGLGARGDRQSIHPRGAVTTSTPSSSRS